MAADDSKVGHSVIQAGINGGMHEVMTGVNYFMRPGATSWITAQALAGAQAGTPLLHDFGGLPGGIPGGFVAKMWKS